MRHLHYTERSHALAIVTQDINGLNLDVVGKLVKLGGESKDCRLGTEHTCRSQHLAATCKAARSLVEPCAHSARRATGHGTLAKSTECLAKIHTLVVEHILGNAVGKVIRSKRKTLRSGTLRNPVFKIICYGTPGNCCCTRHCHSLGSLVCEHFAGQAVSSQICGLAHKTTRQCPKSGKGRRINQQRTDICCQVLPSVGTVA